MSDRTVIKTGITLAIIAAICTTLVAATYQLTEERIAANEKALLEQALQPALSGVFYEGGVSESRLLIAPPHDLPGNDAAFIFRLYAENKPVAALFAVTARDGFSGAIRVLIGVQFDGTITGIRILQHRETPGLGDKIEPQRSDWIFQFDGRSMGDPVVTGWAIHNDGGEFDQLTGASVTPRAVITAIRDTLLYFEAHRDEIFAAESTEDDT